MRERGKKGTKEEKKGTKEEEKQGRLKKKGGKEGSIQPTCQPGWATVDAPPEAFVLTERRGPVRFAVAVLLVVANLQTKGVFFSLSQPTGHDV